MEKPTVDEVLEYAEEQIKYYLRKYAKDAPHEQKEEMSQDARLRVFEAYQRIEADRGWRAFVQRHSFGAIADYLRHGRGCSEKAWTNVLDEETPEALKFRLDFIDEDTNQALDLDDIVGHEQEIFPNLDPAKLININWELVARLCRLDHDLHLFVRHVLLGYPLTELTEQFGVTRERLGQRVSAFVKSIDAPEHVGNPWVEQIIFALGLSGQFQMKSEDRGVGWTLEPVMLKPFEPTETAKNQLTFEFLEPNP